MIDEEVDKPADLDCTVSVDLFERELVEVEPVESSFFSDNKRVDEDECCELEGSDGPSDISVFCIGCIRYG